MRHTTFDAVPEGAEVAPVRGTCDAAPASMASKATCAGSPAKADELILGDRTRLTLRPVNPNELKLHPQP